jgi:hypothetical protein
MSEEISETAAPGMKPRAPRRFEHGSDAGSALPAVKT